eukprot:3651313-Amphidinium_carterae.1
MPKLLQMLKVTRGQETVPSNRSRDLEKAGDQHRNTATSSNSRKCTVPPACAWLNHHNAANRHSSFSHHRATLIKLLSSNCRQNPL